MNCVLRFHRFTELVNNAHNHKMKKLIPYLFFCLPLAATIEVVRETPDPTTQYYFLSMKGAYEHVSGAPHRAAKTYELLKQLSPASEQLRHAMIRLAFERGDYQSVVAHESHIDATRPTHKESALYLAQSHLFCNNTEAALPLLKILRSLSPLDNRIEYYTALTLIKAQRLTEAAAVIQSVLNQEAYEAKHFLFHFLNAKLSFLEADFATAEKHIARCLADNPRFAKGIVLKAVIAEKQNRIDEALKTYESYLELTRDPEITSKVISLCFGTGRYQRALELLASQPRDTADYYHDMALVLYKLNRTKEALKTVKKSLEKDRNYEKAYTLYAHLMIAEQQFDDLRDQFALWLARHPDNRALISSWCRLIERGLPLATATETLAQAAKKAHSFSLMFALADLHHQHAQYEAARRWYEWALQHAPSALAVSKLWFQVACTFYKQNQHQKAHEATKKALAQAVVYPSAHNLMALLLAQTDSETAHAHIQEALRADPTNKAYLATQKQLS